MEPITTKYILWYFKQTNQTWKIVRVNARLPENKSLVRHFEIIH